MFGIRKIAGVAMAVGILIGIAIGVSVQHLGSAAQARITAISLPRPPAAPLPVAGETSRVDTVLSGDTLRLENGLIVRLAGIEAPHKANKQTGSAAWPLAGRARTFLSRRAKGRDVQLYYSGDQRDRYGRAIADVHLGGTSLSKIMTEAGYARVMSWPSQSFDMAPLYRVETIARSVQKNIWNERKNQGFYAVRRPDPDPLAQYIDTAQIVEGIITNAADVRGTIYLNFGADYRTDFTVAISKRDRRKFLEYFGQAKDLTGAHVRVRGWIELRNGPMIWLSDMRRLEVLD